ncbi:MAG: HAMP domain-containing histidine kinase [Lachnospiraceae bacterium]|nr:HAMP domain-containing histidine kinase [Lachnospiraceae bacterium]
MTGRKNIVILTALVLSVSLLAVSTTTMLLPNYYNRAHMQALGEICGKIIEKQPEAEQAIMEAIKEYKYGPTCLPEENIILTYGYKPSEFWKTTGQYRIFFSVSGILSGALLFLIACLLWRQKENMRIKMLTEYLEKVNTGGGGVLLQEGEDAFSKLQDEIYKTVTELRQTREAALKAKNNFAENLYNIAHQIKTSVTSISLSMQMMQENQSQKHLEQMHRQLSRLANFEEALLLLSRIDAGTLSLKQEDVDVFTVLMLAADNLQEMFLRTDVSVDIPESGEMFFCADIEWTMEALMNVLKDCMEHTPSGGTVHCSYEQNPLYTQIKIWDTGSGFAKEDIPHLFERFYRGRKMKGDGIGIGLAISKAIIEAQNGTITARNLINAGACFEIRFYSH